ncbi:emp24/gp25L/p24 family/GOLD-domain-containing protein [Globomyces pollinis-pini]|nr:emp24/gp25L/p24 family/GOLD-domain-containing protein [Globomyces pollinis-pini]
MRLDFILLQFQLVYGFHYYVESGRKKCFTEDLSVDTVIVGAYSMKVAKANEPKVFKELFGSSMKITVFSESSQHYLVDTTGVAKGKFRFTAAEGGTHQICITPNTNDFNDDTKIFFDLKYGQNDEDNVDTTIVDSALNALKMRVRGMKDSISEVRNHLHVQSTVEGEMRELSETINTHTYRFTLIQMFIFVLTIVWQIKSLKGFFLSKKIV